MSQHISNRHIINLTRSLHPQRELPVSRIGKQRKLQTPAEALLQHNGFCRIHKSFLVNLQHIREYIRGEGGSVVLTNDKTIEVSRRKKEVFIPKMKDLFKY